MGLMAEIRARARHVLGSLLGISAVAYFSYHALEGDRGFFAWMRLAEELEAAKAQRLAAAERRRAWEHKVRLLHPESLDPDLLDERIRIMLNYGRPGERVILSRRDEAEEQRSGAPR